MTTYHYRPFGVKGYNKNIEADHMLQAIKKLQDMKAIGGVQTEPITEHSWNLRSLHTKKIFAIIYVKMEDN